MIVEFRIPLPIQVSDFEIAQLFMITKLQENVNPRFDNTDGHMGISPVSGITVPKAKGQYTLKHYLLASMFPSVVKAVLPKDALYLVEEAWNCHPYCMTVMTNGYFAKDRFRVTVESRYVDEDVDMTWMSDIQGTIENIVNLDPASLKKRERIILDIAKREKKESEDITRWHSEKRNIGPLQEGWYEKHSVPHIMWCYKTVTITAKYFGLQTIIESLIRKQQEMIFKRSMCQMIVQMDEWDGLTIEDIRVMEEETKKRLESLIQSEELSSE